MAVAQIRSVAVEPYEDGVPFGDVGPYEVVRAVLGYAVDPATDAGRRIVDLDRAPRDASGRVGFESDLVVVRPVDPNAGNRSLLYSVANRGSVPSLPLSVGAFAMPGLSGRIEPGDGFLLRRGYTVAWSGWQWDVVRGPGMVGLAAPEALDDDGVPIVGPVRVRLQPATASDTLRLAGLALDPKLAPPLPYPPADLDATDAVLTVQDRPDGEASPIDRASWRFVDPDQIVLDGGFEAGRIYEVVYRTARCPIAGAGFLAVRDAVSWLRHAGESDANPTAGRIDVALATGASQSGRFLRHFLSDGDERRRRRRPGLRRRAHPHRGWAARRVQLPVRAARCHLARAGRRGAVHHERVRRTPARGRRCAQGRRHEQRGRVLARRRVARARRLPDPHRCRGRARRAALPSRRRRPHR